MGGVSDDANTTAMKVTSKKAKICCDASFMNCRDSHLPVLSLRARDFFEYSISRGSNTTTTISLSQQLPTLW